ncbi:MAG: hypothetical protein IPN86_03200 [Saprospiraceae bacterium]|nr:hypothetical protein [Saprospiraceae bacterium]
MASKNQKNTFQLPDFSDLHILVIGDVMIDRYISGSVKRISPEAPVPVVEMHDSDNRLGGAANVALNLHALGAEVTLLSIIGQDVDGDVLSEMVGKITNFHNQLFRISSRKTTVKTRIMSGNQHLLRIDNEDTHEIDEITQTNIVKQLEKIISNNKVDGIILQDYNKGMLTENLIHRTIALAKQYKIDTFVDPKEKNFFSYRDCTLFKPNQKEVYKALGVKPLPEIDALLKQKLNNKITLITLGSKGLYVGDEKIGQHFDTEARIISDVCGAGDSVISIVSLCYLKGMPIVDIAKVANTAGGQVCEQPGVVAIDLKNLELELGFKSTK